MSDKVFNTKWDSIEYIDVPGIKSKIYKVNNVLVNYDSKKDPVVVNGNVFIISLSNWQYFHIVQECLGQYEFLKKYIKDLKLIFTVEREDDINKEVFLNDLSGLFKSLVNIYNPSMDEIVIISDQKIIFENVYYLYNFFIPCLRNVVPSNGPIHNTSHEDFSHQFDLSNCVIDKLKKYKNQTPNKKIFISRSKSDQIYIKWKEDYYRYKNNEMSKEEGDRFWDYVMRVGEEAFTQNFQNRIHSDNIKIDNFFIDMGYELVYNEDLTLEEQVYIYSSATHIASIDGTGCYNAIFAHPDTKVFMITTNRDFYWFFDSLIKNVATENVYIIPDRKQYGLGAVHIDEILSELEKNKNLL